MEELLTLSYNFSLPIVLIVGNAKVAGIVEQLDDDHARIAGEWYAIGDIKGVPR